MPFAPMNAAEIFDRVFDIYTKSFGRQMAYAAIAGLASFLVIAFGGGISFMLFGIATLAMPLNFALPGFIALIILFAALVQGALAAGPIILSRQAFLGRLIRLPAYGLFADIMRAVSALVALVIASVPYLLAAGGLLFAYFRFTPTLVYSPWQTRIYVIFSILLLIVVVVGFLLFAHWFAVAVAVAVNERAAFFAALRRSVTLMRHDFWRLFGIRMLWVAMAAALSFAAQGLLTLLPALADMLMAGGGGAASVSAMLRVFTGLAAIVVTFAMMPLDGILTTLIYYNQRIKYEGFDISVTIEQLKSRGVNHAL